MAPKIYQLHITLIGSKPKIWRRILEDSETLLPDLHKILQTTMGWFNAHLHQFKIGKVLYAPPMDEEPWDDLGEVDYTNHKISAFLRKPKDKFRYEYDFGDGWIHDIVLEAVLSPEGGEFYPKCTGGKRHCPPEDCGGVWGYAELLKAISNPKHPDYSQMMEWLGEGFDPEDFDIDQVNEGLKEEDFGCLGMEDFY